MAVVASRTLRMVDPIPTVVISAVGAAGSTETNTGIDSHKSMTKRAIVQKLTVNGQEVDVLVRIQFDSGRLFLDVVADLSIGALSTTVAALSLASSVAGHPSPTKDVVDTQALVAAGGS